LASKGSSNPVVAVLLQLSVMGTECAGSVACQLGASPAADMLQVILHRQPTKADTVGALHAAFLLRLQDYDLTDPDSWCVLLPDSLRFWPALLACVRFNSFVHSS
jgi:hypothetical protein